MFVYLFPHLCLMVHSSLIILLKVCCKVLQNFFGTFFFLCNFFHKLSFTAHSIFVKQRSYAHFAVMKPIPFLSLYDLNHYIIVSLPILHLFPSFSSSLVLRCSYLFFSPYLSLLLSPFPYFLFSLTMLFISSILHYSCLIFLSLLIPTPLPSISNTLLSRNDRQDLFLV